MARLIVYLIIILFQLFFRVIAPLVRRNRSLSGWSRRLEALKSDLKKR